LTHQVLLDSAKRFKINTYTPTPLLTQMLMSDSNVPQDVPLLQDVVRPGHTDSDSNANAASAKLKTDTAVIAVPVAPSESAANAVAASIAKPMEVQPILVQEQLLSPAQRQQLGKELEFVIQRRLEKSLQNIARQVTTELKAHVDKRLTEWLEKAPQRQGKTTPKFNHSSNAK